MLFKQTFIRSFLSIFLVAFSTQAQVRTAIFDELTIKMKEFLQANPNISTQNIPDIKNMLNFVVQDVEVAVLNKPDMVERLLFENIGSDKGFGGYVYQDYLSLKNLAKEFKQYQSPLAGDPVGLESVKQFIVRTYAGRNIVGTEAQIKRFLAQAAQDKDLNFLLELSLPNRLLNFLNDKESVYAKKYYEMMKKIKKMYLGVFKASLLEKYNEAFAEVLQNFVYVTTKAPKGADISRVFDEFGYVSQPYNPQRRGILSEHVDDELTELVKKANGEDRLQLALERLAKEYGAPVKPLQGNRSFYVKYRALISHADEFDDFLVRVLKLLK